MDSFLSLLGAGGGVSEATGLDPLCVLYVRSLLSGGRRVRPLRTGIKSGKYTHKNGHVLLQQLGLRPNSFRKQTVLGF